MGGQRYATVSQSVSSYITTCVDRPDLPDFLTHIEKHGKAWVRGYAKVALQLSKLITKYCLTNERPEPRSGGMDLAGQTYMYELLIFLEHQVFTIVSYDINYQQV